MDITTENISSIAERVEALLAEMTLPEKVGQMMQVEKNSIDKEDITQYALGSLLSGGGGYPTPNTAASWREMVNDFQEYALKSRLGIPLIYGVDAVHGHNNVYGATIFPHNIGLGATRNAELVERIGRATAVEIAATGVHWNFAPAVSVPRDIRWGRTYEGYGEDTALVGELAAAYVRGLQGNLGAPDGVLASVKHFVGDGGTSWGTTTPYPWIAFGQNWHDPQGQRWQIDQGITELDEATLRAVHLPPYAEAIAAGARNIMVSYSSWDGLKMHAQRYLLTDVLKGEMGFTGFLVTDWMAVDQINVDFETAVAAGLNAGLDMIMVPFQYERFINTTLQLVADGRIPLARIDDAVRRILTVKLEMNLFAEPFMGEELLPLVGCAEHRQLAREAVQQSAVLLKNEGNLLPFDPTQQAILVAGAGADDLGMQCGGWTIEWMGQRGRLTEGTTILEGLRALTGANIRYEATAEAAEPAPIGIVVVGEEPYAEGQGDKANLRLSAEDIALLERVRALCDKVVVVLLTGRPLLITEQLPLMDALVVAWLPGTEGQGVADVLGGVVPFSGRLSHAWPASEAHIPRGHGDAAEDVLWPFGAGL
ncbi:MAG: glycoside hydrolase family 3 protein [Chloroflexi bacterium]|nr:glycoside hydrolase family 3 protein [Chloroflexota bacterium]